MLDGLVFIECIQSHLQVYLQLGTTGRRLWRRTRLVSIYKQEREMYMHVYQQIMYMFTAWFELIRDQFSNHITYVYIDA